MDRRVTPPKWVTSPTWGPPPPYKQALRLQTVRILRIQVRASSQTKGLEGGWKTVSQTGERRQKSSQARLARFARVRLFATYSLPMSLLILKFHSHDHQTDNLLRESRHDNSKPIIIASSATTTLSNIYSSHGQLYPTFILHMDNSIQHLFFILHT